MKLSMSISRRDPRVIYRVVGGEKTDVFVQDVFSSLAQRRRVN